MTTLTIVTALTAVLAGQAPPVSAAPAASAATAATAPSVETFNYNPEGRRDPFVSLLRSGTDSRGVRRTPGVDGVASLSVDEISVRGVVANKTGFVAMVVGPDSKTYIVRAHDKLLDGTVKAVTAQGLVILQEVNDPLSLVKQKEIRKMLRGLEEGK